MRFAIYITVLVATLPLVFTRPFFGLCVYYVVSLLDPKLLCWNPTFQDAFLVGIPLVLGAIAIGVHRFRPEKAIDERSKVTSIQWVRERSAIFEFAWPLVVLLVLIGMLFWPSGQQPDAPDSESDDPGSRKPNGAYAPVPNGLHHEVP